jgi:hypothetical protein
LAQVLVLVDERTRVEPPASSRAVATDDNLVERVVGLFVSPRACATPVAMTIVTVAAAVTVATVRNLL